MKHHIIWGAGMLALVVVGCVGGEPKPSSVSAPDALATHLSPEKKQEPATLFSPSLDAGSARQLPVWPTECADTLPPVTPYTFTLNGDSYSPGISSIHGTPDEPRPGDVAFIEGIPVVLDEPGVYKFKIKNRKSGRLYRVIRGKKVLVAVRTYSSFEEVNGEFADKLVDPFLTMTNDELSSLRGIDIHDWTEATWAALDKIDPAKTVVLIQTEVSSGRGALLRIRDDLRYLMISDGSGDELDSYTGLERQTTLRFLTIKPSKTEFAFEDMKRIEGLASLEYLGLSPMKLTAVPSPHALVRLRSLALSSYDVEHRLRSIDFVRHLPALTNLELSWTEVEDVSPVGGHPCLRGIEALSAPVNVLPKKRTPRLVKLNIPDARLQPEEAAAFKYTKPQALLLHSHRHVLEHELEGADALRVRDHGTCHFDPKKVKTLFWVRGKKKVKKLLDRFDVKSGHGYHCGCHGEPTMEFYRKGKLIASIGIHHGLHLRWSGFWPSDASMTDSFGTYLVEWLADKGVTQPKEERAHEMKMYGFVPDAGNLAGN
ncbi:MAG: hypothetical protein GY854_17615 [Deltaproteobacteria bacterium]|nr:hypothetical protein [Deltaproteobacteria bacterium]